MSPYVPSAVAGDRAQFNYSLLERRTAERAQLAVVRVRGELKRTLECIVHVGAELRNIKAILPRGAFGQWLSAEFGWSERTARNFMSVQEWFGPRMETLSNLVIAPTAAYMLAAPSVPDEARRTAIERARAGEHITPAIARSILAQVKEPTRREQNHTFRPDLAPRLDRVLEHFRTRWDPYNVTELALRLRRFAEKVMPASTEPSDTAHYGT